MEAETKDADADMTEQEMAETLSIGDVAHQAEHKQQAYESNKRVKKSLQAVSSDKGKIRSCAALVYVTRYSALSRGTLWVLASTIRHIRYLVHSTFPGRTEPGRRLCKALAHCPTAQPDPAALTGVYSSADSSRRAFYKEFMKVVDAADVVIEVLDARDPLSCRCVDVERLVRRSGADKKVILLLNKIGKHRQILPFSSLPC